MADNQDQSMIEFSEDVSGQAAPVPLPVREYKASIRNAQVHTSQAGKRSVRLELFVDPGQYPHDYTEGPADGTVLPTYRPSLEDTPQGRYSVRRFCEKLGLPVPTKTLDLSTWVSTECKVRVAHERDNNGDMRAKVAEIMGA